MLSRSRVWGGRVGGAVWASSLAQRCPSQGESRRSRGARGMEVAVGRGAWWRVVWRAAAFLWITSLISQGRNLRGCCRLISLVWPSHFREVAPFQFCAEAIHSQVTPPPHHPCCLPNTHSPSLSVLFYKYRAEVEKSCLPYKSCNLLELKKGFFLSLPSHDESSPNLIMLLICPMLFLTCLCPSLGVCLRNEQCLWLPVGPGTV